MDQFKEVAVKCEIDPEKEKGKKTNPACIGKSRQACEKNLSTKSNVLLYREEGDKREMIV